MNNNNNSNLKKIEKLIGYQFKDPHLGRSAITTRAYFAKHTECPDNQALEFLGDAILSFVTAELLYEKWSQYQDKEVFQDMTPEGVMTKIRQEVVNNRYLSECANTCNLCDHIYNNQVKSNSSGEGSSTGHGGDVIEALIAALYLDNNKSISHAKKFILDFLHISNLLNDEERLVEAVIRKNPKDRLIHKFQKLKKYTPHIEYPEIEDRFNPDDNTHLFILGIRINDILLPEITGAGPNKAIAEYNVAEKTYQFLDTIDWDLSKILK